MIKYSLVLLTAAAVMFSVGCDGECCGAAQAEVENAAPVITRVLGVANNSEKTCVPAETLNLDPTASDADGNLDTSSYSWTIDDVTTTSGTVDCPADGEETEVCATVKDDEGAESNEVCVKLKGQAQQASCPPLTITAKNTGADTEVSSFVGGQSYDLENSRVDCPNTTCTWSIHSTQNVGDYTNTFDCFDETQPHVDVTGTTTPATPATPAITVNTCAYSNGYRQVRAVITCTGDAAGTETIFFPLVEN